MAQDDPVNIDKIEIVADVSADVVVNNVDVVLVTNKALTQIVTETAAKNIYSITITNGTNDVVKPDRIQANRYSKLFKDADNSFERTTANRQITFLVDSNYKVPWRS